MRLLLVIVLFVGSVPLHAGSREISWEDLLHEDASQ